MYIKVSIFFYFLILMYVYLISGIIILLLLILVFYRVEKFTPYEKIAWELNFPQPIDFPFSKHPTVLINNCNFSRPWCVDKFGIATPCPCPNLDPYLKEIGPVPVLNSSKGAYTPSRFCPGVGIC